MWYILISKVTKSDSYIEIQGSFDNFVKYFHTNNENINAPKILGAAQEGLTKKELFKLDYLEEIRMLNVPVFSKKFVKIMSVYLEGAMTFHPCIITYKNEKLIFYVGRILNILPAIDIENSGYDILSNGDKIIDSPIIIKDNIDPNLLIVRDEFEYDKYFVSYKFKELVEYHKLNIGFLESNYSFWS